MNRKRPLLHRITKINSWSNFIRLLIILGLFVAGVLLLWVSSLQIPDFKNLAERKISQSTKIYDRTGKVLLYDIHQNVTRRVVSSGDISPYLKNATVSIEDNGFYEHSGVEFGSMVRSTLVNLESGSLKQGGSTITQQIIKNALLTSDKLFSRKIKEIILALKLERVMSKDEILALYLNEIPYGGSIYGAEDASQKFFGKDVKNISLAEGAYLASIPRAPTFYSPYGNNKAQLDKRKNLVIDKMIELKYIDKTTGELAKKERVDFLKKEEGGIKAPHFVEFVKSYLEEKYGQEYLETKGLKIITTLDWDMEQRAEQIVNKYATENETKFNAKNAGMVVIDPKTGQVLVMVGSRDYFNKENEGNFNITIAHRQPGSAFKPFVYATAFNKGYLPETVLMDLPTEFQTTCSPEGKPLNSSIKESDCYSPVNYDGKYVGPISLRDALAQSRNIPAIKLLYLAGINSSIETARNMGIRGLDDPMRYGLTLVLGGGEVSLLDITSAYSVFANDGIRNPYNIILRAEDNTGAILEEYTSEGARVLPQNTARMVNDILSDIKTRAPLFGEVGYADIPGRELAIKTGTTNDFRDAWVVGYTPNLAIGVWAGNNDNTPMEKKVSGYIALPMWREFVRQTITSLPVEQFIKPDQNTTNNTNPLVRGFWQGGITYDIDKISGKLATEYTPKETRETKSIKQIHSILYWVDKNNPTGPAPKNPGDDSQFNLWETAVLKWARENKITDETSSIIPTQFDNIHRPELAPKISFASPISGTIYGLKDPVIIKVINTGNFPTSQIDFFINNTYLGSSKSAPFNLSFTPDDIQNINGTNILKVVVYDTVLNKTEAETTLTLAI